MDENFHTREDLFQQAKVYLWRIEQEHPGQTRSWYLQGVRSHLKDVQRSGRSIDSPKRSGARLSLPDNCDEWDHWRDGLQFDDGFLSTVAARDVISLLMARLNSRDQRILGELAGGRGPREIAAMLEVSHPLVVQRRRHIAKLAIKLGINPLPAALSSPLITEDICGSVNETYPRRRNNLKENVIGGKGIAKSQSPGRDDRQ
jgi:hypothetical protein